jgi:hypothetical protein
MPTYAALLYYTEDYDWTSPELADWMKEYDVFGVEAGDVVTGGAALQPTTTATTIQIQGGQGGDVIASDGPYAEAKEILGGFYLLTCADLDEAISWAKRIPAAWHGRVEVRPCVNMDA